MNVLDNVGGKWKSVADFQSVHNNIQEVEFADLNGDGNKEIIVGWTVFQDSYSKLMSVYEISSNKKAVRIYPVCGAYYSMFKVADFDANGKEDILTLKYATAGSSAEYTGTVLSYDNNGLKERKSFALDKSVNSVAAINYDYIENRFFEQIGQKYRPAFAEYRNDLLAKIRFSCGSSILGWATQGGKIVSIIDEHLKKVNETKVKSGAKDRIKQLSKHTTSSVRSR